MSVTITPQDLAAYIPDIDTGLAGDLIAGVIARAVLVAPCICSDVDWAIEAAMRAILIDVIVRRYWALKKAGTSVTDTFGPFSYTERYGSSADPLFSDREADDLRTLCMKASGADPSSGVAGPVGSFPDAEDYDQFFVRPSDYNRWPLVTERENP